MATPAALCVVDGDDVRCHLLQGGLLLLCKLASMCGEALPDRKVSVHGHVLPPSPPPLGCMHCCSSEAIIPSGKVFFFWCLVGEGRHYILLREGGKKKERGE